jgi:DNA-binding NarL/FixJ family response regulator
MIALPPHPVARVAVPAVVVRGSGHRRHHLQPVRLVGGDDQERRRLRDRRALSARELEVLRLASRGLTGAQIAEQLCLSESTIETHVRRAVQALGAHNRVHAVALAIGQGLIDAPSS